MRTFGTAWFLALLLAACSWPGGATGGPQDSSPSAPTAPPNIVLVTIDTLRADHLSCYGDRQGLTPGLDALAAEGILFEQALTPAPLTLPAHASLMTGTLPVHHGVRDNTGFVLASSHATLAESLSAAGYQTGAFVGAFVLDSRFGLDQGFDTYFDDFSEAPLDQLQLDISERPAGEVLAQAKAWIRARSSQRPWFAWIHLFDPHAPYQPPAAFSSWGEYAGEVAFVDAQLSQFFRFLREQGSFDRSLIVVTSDHGEGLGEHGEDTHGMFLYDSTLRVPLIVKLAGGRFAGRRVAQQVGLVDLMPTILLEAGLESPRPVQGRPVQPAWTLGDLEETPTYAETLLPLLNYGWSDLQAIRSGGYKWIDAPQPELYFLASDPGERDNLYSPANPVAKRLSSRLDELVVEFSTPASASSWRRPDPETRQRLQSLGYAAAGAPAGKTPADRVELLQKRDKKSRPDPKEKIVLFNQIWRAQGAAQQQRHQQAVEILDAVLARDSGIFMAHSIRSLALLELGQPRRALDSLQEAVKLRPEDPGAHLYMGLAQQQVGRVDEAIESFETAWLLDPDSTAARNNLAAMLGRQQRFGEAARIFETMVREQPTDLAARLNLGGAYLMQNRYEDARRHLQFVEQREPDIPELQNNLGLLHLRTGNLRAAEEHLLRALQLRPRYASAHRNLAEVYRRLGQPGESERHLRAARELGDR